jgi:hypothetical protein
MLGSPILQLGSKLDQNLSGLVLQMIVGIIQELNYFLLVLKVVSEPIDIFHWRQVGLTLRDLYHVHQGHVTVFDLVLELHGLSCARTVALLLLGCVTSLVVLLDYLVLECLMIRIFKCCHRPWLYP